MTIVDTGLANTVVYAIKQVRQVALQTELVVPHLVARRIVGLGGVDQYSPKVLSISIQLVIKIIVLMPSVKLVVDLQ